MFIFGLFVGWLLFTSSSKKKSKFIIKTTNYTGCFGITGCSGPTG